MGFFSGIKTLFGGSESISRIAEKGADGIYNGIDKLFYTDEEKAEARAKAGSLYLDFIKVAYDENSTRSVTRRWLAFIIVGPMMGCFIGGAIANFFSPEAGKYLLSMFSELVPWGGGILMFYFGSHLATSIRK
jgi:hypothetical protein